MSVACRSFLFLLCVIWSAVATGVGTADRFHLAGLKGTWITEVNGPGSSMADCDYWRERRIGAWQYGSRDVSEMSCEFTCIEDVYLVFVIKTGYRDTRANRDYTTAEYADEVAKYHGKEFVNVLVDGESVGDHKGEYRVLLHRGSVLKVEYRHEVESYPSFSPYLDVLFPDEGAIDLQDALYSCGVGNCQTKYAYSGSPCEFYHQSNKSCLGYQSNLLGYSGVMGCMVGRITLDNHGKNFNPNIYDVTAFEGFSYAGVDGETVRTTNIVATAGCVDEDTLAFWWKCERTANGDGWVECIVDGEVRAKTDSAEWSYVELPISDHGQHKTLWVSVASSATAVENSDSCYTRLVLDEVALLASVLSEPKPYTCEYDGKEHYGNFEVYQPVDEYSWYCASGDLSGPPKEGWEKWGKIPFTKVGTHVLWYYVDASSWGYYKPYTNYTTVTITPKPLTVTADAKTQIYGKAAKPLTYTTVGLCSGDALTGALTREPGEDVGEYDILQGTLANGNYAISYTGAKYTIKNRIYENEEIVIEKTDDGWDVTLTNDVYELRFPDNLGVVRVNMNGFSIFGRDADTYGELNPGVLIYPVPEDGNATKMSFVGNGSVCGGSITWNRPDTWGTAGDGICVDDEVREGVVISIGAGLTVWGGGGYATWGGNGVRGYVLSNDGKIYGGEGSVAGAGVKGTVYFNRGTILGGDNSTWMISGEMGTAGVVGIVGCNEGLIIGGEGANDCDSITGDLWAGTAESVGDGEISGAWGNDTFSLPEGLSEEEIVAAARANRNAVSCRYDGNPHAISVPTYEVFKSSVRYSLNRVGPYLAECPKYSDATEVVIWYVNESEIFEPVVTNAAMLSITKGTIPGGGEEPGTGMIPEGGLSKFDAVRVYNGKGQTIDLEKLGEAFADVVGDDFTISFANCESGGQGLSALPPTEGWGDVPPTITDIGELVMWYKVTSPNYEDYVHQAKVTVVEKVITDEMVQPGEDAFFFDGDDKKPTVDVQYFVDGKDICTESDYTLAYGTKAGAGWWVMVSGKGNYSGTVTKIVPVLKRPVAPPVVTSKSYTGKLQKPTIPTDSRWTVVANPGGINVGEYPNVVLRLTNTTDYKWKGGAEDQTDITLVFKVTKGNNGWSRQPDMKCWAYGETPSEPSMGQARYGTVKVAYRKAGADVSTETATRPELPGKYLARFWVDETENFIGVAVHEPYKDIAFEITGTGPEPSGDVTETTPVPVPHDWLDAYVAEFGGGDYETAANAKGKNGVALWESYVAGLDPTVATSQFTAIITMGADGKPVITWEPDMSKADPPRVYVEYGKANLGDKDWTPVTDANRAAMRFFKVGVEIK